MRQAVSRDCLRIKTNCPLFDEKYLTILLKGTLLIESTGRIEEATN